MISSSKLSGDQIIMLAYMNERRKELNDKMNVSVIEKWFPLTELKKETIVGGFSWTSMPLKAKWIHIKNAHNIGAGNVSPADIARDYLNVKYGGKRRRCTTAQYQLMCTVSRSQPLAALPSTLEHGVYLDLSHAYWSIIQAVGWDVDYHPSRFLNVKSSCSDFPVPDIKLARNCLVSMGLSSNMRIWTGEKLVFIKKYNPLQNLILWYLVQDVLHGIAQEMSKIAYYINTDGYIVNRKHLNQAFEIIAGWGLPCSVKYEGQAEIYGVGQYNITGKRWVEPRSTKRQGHKKIDPVNVTWLKPRIRLFAERRIVY